MAEYKRTHRAVPFFERKTMAAAEYKDEEALAAEGQKEITPEQYLREREGMLQKAADLQSHFEERLRAQIKVLNRLTAQRNALEALCLEAISQLEQHVGSDLVGTYRDRLEKAKAAGD